MATMILQTEIEKRKGIRYEFETTDLPIGEGGMGKVYKGVCVNERNGSTRPVAIKFMYDDLPANAYERARREAEIQLRNDNLVEMLGFLETQEQQMGEIRKHYHVVSELLTGVSLRDVMDGKTTDRDGHDVPFAVKMLQDYKNDPEHFATKIVVSILSGLMALHDAGYIHRDIDPSNIMLTTEGHIKLIDFGIAKQMNSLTTGDKSLTVAGKFMGKPEYAAPELALGDIAHQNQTTDIYAVGILLYQCIIGHTPFEGPRHEILEMQIKKKMPLDKIKNKALRKIIATACEKKQELRYPTCSQMRAALETINGAKQAMSSQKKYTIAGIAAAVIIAIAGISFIVTQKQAKAKEEAEIARVEQQKAEANAAARAAIDEKIHEAAKYLEMGKTKANEDNYENDLIKAYALYVEAEKLAKASPDAGCDVADLKAKKQETMQLVDEALQLLTEQKEEMQALGSDEAQFYEERINVINDFKTKQ